jgi:hypothetical protein
MEEGYFLMADLLGFSRMVKNLSEEALSKRIDSWVDLVQKSAEEAKVSRFQLISDSLLAATDGESSSLSHLIHLARLLLEKGIRNSFPIRGAISFGTYTWGNLTYGKAVIHCHELEKNQQWVGIACTNSLPHVEEHWSFDDGLVCYPVPMSNGLIQTFPAVAWEIPDTLSLMSNLGKGGLIKEGGENLEWEWERKVGYTIQYRLYMKLLEKCGKSPSGFCGFHPLQAIEMNFPPTQL